MFYLGSASVEGGNFYGIFSHNKGLTGFYPISPDFYEFLYLIENESKLVRIVEKYAREEIFEFTFLPPVKPTKIIAVGLNYKDHAREFGQPIPDEPLIFLKPPSSIVAHLAPIVYPLQARQVDYEAELAVVIKRKAKNVEEHEAKNYILGFTCANDVTERFYQKKDGQWTRAKGFDTFAPIGPWINPDIRPEDGLKIQSIVNGEVKQDSNTREMIFAPEKLVSFISKIMTLEPGDIIMTGTPSGVGPLKPGDTVEIFIENIGTLKNPVV